MLVLLSAGCSRYETLDDVYGKLRGSPGARSVNGTAVLARMFEDAGHRVTTRRKLSPALERCNVIVWAPDDFQPPTEKQREYLEDWLSNDSDRTLIYIGRDYDAAPDYWKTISGMAPPAQVAEISRRQGAAKAKYEVNRAEMPADEYCRWFVSRRRWPVRPVQELSGPWSNGIDPTQASIQVGGLLDVPREKDRPAGDTQDLPEFEVLLKSKEDPLVIRVTDYWHQGQILVVANGSFLLNFPLVNRENRKLATRLVDECGGAEKVVFLESGPNGPPISDSNSEAFTGMEVLTIWPMNFILLHAAALGILFCCWRFPIFGRPSELPPETVSDFGRHVEALGELIEQSGERKFALDQLTHYLQTVRRESGISHATPRGPAAAVQLLAGGGSPGPVTKEETKVP